MFFKLESRNGPIMLGPGKIEIAESKNRKDALKFTWDVDNDAFRLVHLEREKWWSLQEKRNKS